MKRCVLTVGGSPMIGTSIAWSMICWPHSTMALWSFTRHVVMNLDIGVLFSCSEVDHFVFLVFFRGVQEVRHKLNELGFVRREFGPQSGLLVESDQSENAGSLRFGVPVLLHPKRAVRPQNGIVEAESVVV